MARSYQPFSKPCVKCKNKTSRHHADTHAGLCKWCVACWKNRQETDNQLPDSGWFIHEPAELTAA